jgi:hypothetical protein
MTQHRLSTTIIYLFLRLGVILYVLPFFYQVIIDPNLGPGFWQNLMRFAAGVLFLFGSVFAFIVTNSTFDLYGFSVVLIVSLYRFITTLIEDGFTQNLSVQFLMIVVAVYFMNKYRKKRVTNRAFV